MDGLKFLKTMTFPWPTTAPGRKKPEEKTKSRPKGIFACLIRQNTFIDDSVTIEHARDYGHTHLFEIADYAESFQNKAILLIHFSARYQANEIHAALSSLPPAGQVYALTEGF